MLSMQTKRPFSYHLLPIGGEQSFIKIDTKIITNIIKVCNRYFHKEDE